MHTTLNFFPPITIAHYYVATSLPQHHDEKPGCTAVTVRLRVSVPPSAKLPNLVRLVVKERDALFFPYRRKLTSIPLHLASWTRLPGAVWQSNTVSEVAMDVPKLLKKTLQLYCLDGSTVKHKAIGNLERLLHQENYEELVLDVHYPGCPFEAQAKTARQRRAPLR